MCHTLRHLWVVPKPHSSSENTVLNSFWKSYLRRHVTDSIQSLGQLFDKSLEQRAVQSKTALQLGRNDFMPLFTKTYKPFWDQEIPKDHLVTRALSKHSSNLPIFSVIRGGTKRRSVWDCAWGVVLRGRRNNICGFSFALRWLNDDMGPFLLPCKVTF